MAGPVFQPGKRYLKSTKTGHVYLWQPGLAKRKDCIEWDPINDCHPHQAAEAPTVGMVSALPKVDPTAPVEAADTTDVSSGGRKLPHNLNVDDLKSMKKPDVLFYLEALDVQDYDPSGNFMKLKKLLRQAVEAISPQP
jgi:hypothetical protein